MKHVIPSTGDLNFNFIGSLRLNQRTQLPVTDLREIRPVRVTSASSADEFYLHSTGHNVFLDGYFWEYAGETYRPGVEMIRIYLGDIVAGHIAKEGDAYLFEMGGSREIATLYFEVMSPEEATRVHQCPRGLHVSVAEMLTLGRGGMDPYPPNRTWPRLPDTNVANLAPGEDLALLPYAVKIQVLENGVFLPPTNFICDAKDPPHAAELAKVACANCRVVNIQRV
jgi:hypothetical protein